MATRRVTDRQIGKAFRLQQVAVPALRFHRINRNAKPLRQPCHEDRILPAATGDQPTLGLPGSGAEWLLWPRS